MLFATSGEPSATTWFTRSGSRTPSTRANIPPRLWPMIDTSRS